MSSRSKSRVGVCKPNTALEWVFLGVVVVQAVFAMASQGNVLALYLAWINPQVYQVPSSFLVPTSFAVAAVGCFFQVFAALDSFRIKNNIQIWAQCVINICLSTAVGFQYYQVKGIAESFLDSHDMFGNPFVNTEVGFWKWAHPALISCTIVSSICSVCMCFLAYRLHVEFAWSLYEQISPDRQMKSRHLKYQLYLVFLKITVFVLILFIIAYDFVCVHFVEPEFSLTISIIPAAVLHAGLAGYCAKRELKLGMAFILVVHLALLAYLSSRLFLLGGNGKVSRTFMKEQMVLFASISLISGLMATITAVICLLNFGKGLKPLLLGEGRKSAPVEELELHSPHLMNGIDYWPKSHRFDME